MSDSSEDETTHAAEASEQSIRSETDSGETTSAANDSDRKAKQKKIAKRLLKSATAKRGVVYINRPPPYMRPDKVRHLLQQYADITRIYLAPEDETVRRRRRKEGGNRKQRYTEGWVEFASKKEAKRVVALLNGTMLGGKKRFYREDVWTLKYLSKFKWSHLTEKMRYERIVREKKLKASMSQAKKESDFVRKKVGQARRIEYAKAKGLKSDGGKQGKTMVFKQRPVSGKRRDTEESSNQQSSGAKSKRTRTRFFEDDDEQ